VDKLKVLIVDDALVYRKVLSEAVQNTGLAEVMCTASNGIIALEKIQHHSVDVVLLDVNMPEMDGIETLKIIRSQYPHIHVIMVSSVGRNDAEIVLKALRMGAMDFLVKPMEADYNKNMKKITNFLKILFTQIKVRYCSNITSEAVENIKQKLPLSFLDNTTRRINQFKGADLIVVASSTGGPVALETIFKQLTNEVKIPILVVQHMPREFINMMAKALDKKCALTVEEAKEGQVISNNKVLIAPGGFHLTVSSEGNIKKVRLKSTPHVNGVRPAADVLFKSVAEHYAGKKVIAVILTGMGSDGMRGVKELKKNCHCYCITQSKDSCAVYGMPKSVFEAGLSDEVVALEDIAARLKQLV